MELSARELRIGNIVKYEINDTFNDRKPYYGKSIYQVNVIMDDRVKLEIGFDALQPVLFSDPKLKPIPLTEDWLLKFGFDHSIDHKLFNMDAMCLSYSDNHEGYRLYVNHEYETGIPLIYVHQLQNLFYFLTGEELKIN